MHTNATLAAPQHTIVKIIPNEKGNPDSKPRTWNSTSSTACSPV